MNKGSSSLKQMGRLAKVKQDQGFIVVHFAGEVVYEVEGFLEKNNDQLHDSLVAILNDSSVCTQMLNSISPIFLFFVFSFPNLP